MDDTSGLSPEMTYGEKAVGFTFNPSNDSTVDTIKRDCAALIDILKTQLEKEPTYGVAQNENSGLTMIVYSERGQLLLEAIRQIQTAQMWAVKAVTFKI